MKDLSDRIWRVFRAARLGNFRESAVSPVQTLRLNLGSSQCCQIAAAPSSSVDCWSQTLHSWLISIGGRKRVEY